MDHNKKQPIVEAYPCLQSEGSLTGVPHFLIRTTGCTLRCQFSETDFCDSWYTSWHPEKGEFTLQTIWDMYEKYPHIKHVMISGGSPTMHAELLRELTIVSSRDYNMHITLETEGSLFVEGCVIDLLSLSPKFSNSLPRIGTKTPNGKDVTAKHYARHEKHRKNYDAMKKWISSAADYQLKPVFSSIEDMDEIEQVMNELNVPKTKTWLMPAGSIPSELAKKRVALMEFC